MHVVLIRHAAAVDATAALSDPARFLSDAGRAQVRSLGERLRWCDCAPTEVWTSPLVRAVQTAELLATCLNWRGTVIAEPSLAPGGTPDALHERVERLAATAVVVLVGHEPGLSGLGSRLIGSELGQLRTAEAARIIDGRLRWRFAHDDEAPRTVPSE